MVSPLECPGDERWSAPTPTRGPGQLIALACGEGVCHTALCCACWSPPNHWATLFLLAFPLCKMLLCPYYAQCWGVGSLKPGTWDPGHQRFLAGVHRLQECLLSRPPCPPSTWASYNLLALVLTSRTGAGSGPGSPAGAAPPAGHLRLPTQLLLHLPRLCRGKGLCLINKPPSPFPGLPLGKGAFGLCQDLAAAAPVHSASCPPQKGQVGWSC